MFGEKPTGGWHPNKCPYNHRQPRYWDYYALDEEQVPYFVWGEEHEGQLDQPIDEVAQET